MRWFFRTLVITVVVISAYTAWPIYGLAQLGEAFRSRDVAQINNLVDFPALRRSIAAQIIATYLKMTGQDAAMGQLGSSLAVGIGSTLADAEVERIVSPEGLLMLFERGQVADLPASAIAPSMQIDVGKAFKLWTDADYRGQRVFFLLPPDVPRAQQYRVRMFLSDWRWKLTAIDLPDDLKTALAREILKRNPRTK